MPPSLGTNVEGARLATDEDVAAIVAIAGKHRDEIADERGAALLLRQEGFSTSAFEASIRAGLHREDALIVSGTYDGVVFGYSAAEIEVLEDGGLLMGVTDFIVEREIRKSGIGEAMMNLLLDEARSRKCLGIDSRALPGDRNTKNFFESFGLKARMLTVHRALDDL